MTDKENTGEVAGSVHISVLLNEVIDGLNLSDNALVLDATFGGGGHSSEICKRYKNINIIAIDEDAGAWGRAKDKFKNLSCEITFNNINFRNLDTVVSGEVDAVMMDLGFSSDQLDEVGRGFTFKKDEPLLMTLSSKITEATLTAKEILNTWDEENIASIIYGYGEEKFSRKIAKAIVERRKTKKFETTFDLVNLLDETLPAFYKRQKIHFATRTFQALRIAVNDELQALSDGLYKGVKVLKQGGRIAVISFHSLEDRIVKNFFRNLAKDNFVKLINKKPIEASEKEKKENPRCRSAKLRIIEKI